MKLLLTEKLDDRKARLDHAKAVQTNDEQIRIPMDNVLLDIKMNALMMSVQTIHDHITKFVSLLDSWRNKNYTFELVAAINQVVADDIFIELRASLFHAPIVDESTDIALHNALVLYFKYRSPNPLVYKTVFDGIIQLTACHAPALEQTIKELHNEHEIDINRLVMSTSDGTSVMLDR